jgi:hypothetical protein
MFENHSDHLFINHYALNTFIMNMSVLCYTIFHFYVLIESNNKNTFIHNKLIHSNRNQLVFLIKIKLKNIFYEQVVFRVYLVEVMKYIMEEETIHILWSIIFATYYFKYYNCDYKIRIAKFINIYLMSYYVLYNVPYLASLLIHWYTELFSIAFSSFLYKSFNVNIKTKPNNVSKLKPIAEEFATKDEVEALLSNKKFD